MHMFLYSILVYFFFIIYVQYSPKLFYINIAKLSMHSNLLIAIKDKSTVRTTIRSIR